MQTPSGHCRCKKTQTPSRHEPKTAQTASQKTVSRYLWNPHIKQSLEPQSTSPAYANTIWTLQMQKDPKHHLDTSRKPPKPQAQKLFHVTFGIHIKQSLEPQSTMPSLCKHHLEPHKTTLEPQSTCPAYANTIWTLQMQKDSKHHPNRKPKNCFTLPLEST